MTKKLKTIIFFLGFFLFFSALLPHSALAAEAHPARTLVQSGAVIWQISEDSSHRFTIDSPEKFYSNRLSYNYVVPANAADLALPEIGNLAWGDGALFTDQGTIYQISQGSKHGFVSAEVFLGQGFAFNQARPGNLSALPQGEPVTRADARHLAGTFLRSPTGTIFLQTSTGSQAFPQAAVFYSHGGKFTDVVPANFADAVSAAEIANYKTGSIVNDNGVIWAIRQNMKYGFPSAECFLNFGYTFTIALNGSTAGLNPVGNICGEASPIVPGGVSSYSTSQILTSQGTFSVELATFNLASQKIRVITDTAADRDCATDCPVAPLSAYATVNNGQAGMNGTYLCPTAYPDCAGKTNSFFWKVLDTKLGKIINENNGLGDEDPFITFDSLGQAKYFHRFLDYKNSGLSAVAGINSASIIENGNITLNYAKLDDKQKTTKSTQGALALKGQTLYLLHVFNATVPDAAMVLQSLGADFAILLDGGGSTAMMYEGKYKSGPGRNIPNAVVVQILP